MPAPKKRKPEGRSSLPQASQASSTPSTNPPKASEIDKPTINEIVGGKSWTGKLPLTLFFEHCIRNGWGKPLYDNPRKVNGGFITTVRISFNHPRSSESETVTFTTPTCKSNGDTIDSVQPTPLESRHYCATYALHRVSSMKNIHHMLPPTHRRFWSVLEDFKKEEIKAGKAWRYEADPFAAQRMQDAERLKRDAKREAVNVRDAKNVGGVKPKPGCNSRMNDWRWQIAPTVDMGSERRREIEDLIRRYHVWNPRGIELKPESREKIVEHLTVLGFRKSHAEEACDWVQDLEEALEWLLIHVPEDDIPNRFLPENYIAGVTVAMSENLDIAYAAKRLNSIGYPVNLCHEVLAQNCYSEDRAAEALMQILLYGRQKSPTGLIVQDLKGSSKSQNNEIWQQEQSSLEAIYGSERFQMVSPHLLKITLDLRDGNGVENLPNIILEVRQPTIYPGSLPYPQTIPTFAVVSDGDKKLPAYVKLSIIRQTAEYAESFKGEPMVYTVAGWLEDEILRITDNPGRLRDLTTATSGIDGRKCFPVGQRRKAGMFCQKRAPIDWVPVSHESLDTIESRTERQEALKQQKMTEMRRKLPAWQLRHDIVKAVNSAQVVIISGETGSGKSTQSVQFVLDDLVQRKLGSVANIICTQPRRISALGLADRVSEERCQRVGEEIGYIIRGESKQSAGTTKITFVTTGVLLRRLQTGDLLTDVSHIFVDEVHERSLDTDFLLILIKRIISRRRDLKIILMSATLDADVFSAYFGGDEVVHRIEIEGRTFPVTDYYLDEVIDSTGFSVRGMLGSRPAGRTDEPSTDSDLNVDGINSSIGAIIRTLGDRINYDLIAATVMHINDQAEDTDGGILIFLPGAMEIQRCVEAVKSLPGGLTRYYALPLHASLHPSEQRRVFLQPPSGMRKVIVATNVAETSITIQDIVFVIDTGKVKETSYDAQNKVVKLEEMWVSRAGAKQRRGRAGRVRAGKCYKLYTKNVETFKMADTPVPELQRVPLEQTCLSAKAMGIKDVRAFLSAAISPPDTIAVDSALGVLEKMGAISDNQLTPLGKHMATIPADLRCAKLMVYGILFQCLDPVLTIASILTTKSPFLSPIDKRAEAKGARVQFAKSQGDLVADCRAFEKWVWVRNNSSRRELGTWCEINFISYHTMVEIASNRAQYLNSLRDCGFLSFRGEQSSTLEKMNKNKDSDVLLRALIAGAFHPQIARIQLPQQKFASSSTGSLAVDPEAKAIKYFTADNARVFIHPSSTVFDAQQFIGNAPFMVYFSKWATAKVFLRECTPVNTYSVLLFGGKIEADVMGQGIVLDGWLRLKGWGRIGILVQKLRAMLDEALEAMVDDPGILARSSNGEVAYVQLVDCAVSLVVGDGI